MRRESGLGGKGQSRSAERFRSRRQVSGCCCGCTVLQRLAVDMLLRQRDVPDNHLSNLIFSYKCRNSRDTSWASRGDWTGMSRGLAIVDQEQSADSINGFSCSLWAPTTLLPRNSTDSVARDVTMPRSLAHCFSSTTGARGSDRGSAGAARRRIHGFAKVPRTNLSTVQHWLGSQKAQRTFCGEFGSRYAGF